MADPTRRTEDDLRAAFALAAQEAPSTQDVLARLAESERSSTRAVRPTPKRSWLPIAAVAAAVIAIAVPVGFAVSGGGNNSKFSTSSIAGGADIAKAPSAGSGESFAAGASGSAGGGPPNTPTRPDPTLPTSGPSAGRTCTPTDVSLSLTWKSSGNGLAGVLTATNHTAAACDLLVKPAIYPLDTDGNRLPVDNVISAEGKIGPSRLLPGATATSAATWFSWCGTKPSARTQVEWGTGIATTIAAGPAAPNCTTAIPNTISSGWFGPLS